MWKWVLVTALSLTMAGCGSWAPSWMRFSIGSVSPQADLRIDSDPPGADARSSTGANCRTPCVLSLPATELTVTVSSAGYLPQTVPVRPRLPDDPRGADGGGPLSASLTPNPVFVQLEPEPPPPVAKRKPAKRPKKAAAAPPPASSAPAQSAASNSAWPSQPAPASASAPWPSQPAASPWPSR